MTQDSPTETSERALLFVMMDMPAEHDEEFNRWYDNEHLPERLASPGFLSARRFSALAGTNPRHLALYELISTGALETPEYLQVSGNPTEATRRVLSLRKEGGGAMCMSGSPDRRRPAGSKTGGQPEWSGRRVPVRLGSPRCGGYGRMR